MTKIHPEVESYHLLNRTHYPPDMPNNRFLRLLQSPKLLFAGYRKSPLISLRLLSGSRNGGRVPSLRLLQEGLPMLGKEPYDIIHCHFGPNGLKAMRLRDMGVFRGKTITTYHGYDVSRYPKIFGEHVYDW
jgi:colanic acid/amylovoran biosynthesis glycosyltransferase